MRVLAGVVAVFVLGGCTSVKMVQRDGCWVRRTEKRLLGTVQEEVGPCARPATAFVENDPLTRMVQECVSRADYRWQMRALAAWDRHEPWPQQLTESSVLQQCMDDSARGVLGETALLKQRNGDLQHRLDDALKEQAALRQRNDQERKEYASRSDAERNEFFKRAEETRRDLVALQSKLADHLGDAAKKVQPLPAMPPPTPAIATATATSEGRSSSEQASDSQTQPASLALLPSAGGPVTATATMTPGSTAACVAPADPTKSKDGTKLTKRAATKRRQARAPRATAKLPACDPSAAATGSTSRQSAPATTAAQAGTPKETTSLGTKSSAPAPSSAQVADASANDARAAPAATSTR